MAQPPTFSIPVKRSPFLNHRRTASDSPNMQFKASYTMPNHAAVSPSTQPQPPEKQLSKYTDSPRHKTRKAERFVRFRTVGVTTYFCALKQRKKPHHSAHIPSLARLHAFAKKSSHVEKAPLPRRKYSCDAAKPMHIASANLFSALAGRLNMSLILSAPSHLLIPNFS